MGIGISNHVFFWIFLVYAFLVQAAVILIIQEERRGSLRLPDGRISTFEVSCGAGIALWFFSLVLISDTVGNFSQNGQNTAMVIAVSGSLFLCCVFSEAVTQFFCRRLFKDVEFARFGE